MVLDCLQRMYSYKEFDITASTGSFTGKVHVGTTDGIVIDGNVKNYIR